MSFPKMVRVRQRLIAPAVSDVRAAVHAELQALNVAGQVTAGQRIAIPAGSRGISNIVTILDTVVRQRRGSVKCSPPTVSPRSD